MKKIYLLASALILTLAINAQTTININELNPVVTTIFEGETVIDVNSASSVATNALISIANPFLGTTTTEIEISFDVYNYGNIAHLGTLVSFVNITSVPAIDGRLYFSNGSYLGYNYGGWYDVNAGTPDAWSHPGTDFIGLNSWKNIKLSFTDTGYSVFVDNVLSYDLTAGTVNRAGILTDHSIVMDFLKNTATNFLIGTGSWWSDNTNPEGNYWDAQNSYMKNITLSTSISTSINKVELNNADIISTEYFSITGANVGSNYSALQPGMYIQKSVYSNGAVRSTKIVKSRK